MSPRPAGPRPSSTGGAPLVSPQRDHLDRSQVAGPLRVEPPLGRGVVERDPVPTHGPSGQPTDRYAERSRQVTYNAAIVLVATIVVGQLWGLTVALDAWLSGDSTAVGWILAFEVASFAVSLGLWIASSPRQR